MGIISDIQRFSVDDGPGIRTTVFCKGCNLDCHWCHNPETKSPFPQKRIIGGHDTICGKETSPQEILDVIKRDKAFYIRSGGGATFSGGEPFIQPLFLYECLKLCKENGFHTTVDTAGNIPFEVIKELSGYIDLLLYDIKILDDELHKKYTNVSNQRIIENFGLLSGLKPQVIVSTLLLPGVNDNEKYFEQFAEFIGEYPFVKKVRVLPYHSMGESKYIQIGESYRFSGRRPPDESKAKKFQDEIDRTLKQRKDGTT